MKKLFLLFLVFATLIAVNLSAQELFSLDWDFDTLFDEPPPEEETPADTAPAAATPASTAPVTTVLDSIRRRGFIFDASYMFRLGFNPYYEEYPWDSDFISNVELEPYILMRNTFGIDAQISDVFRVKSTLSFEIPYFIITLGDFFFDYNIADTVFLRGGKYNLAWGLASNFNFTDLLARLPPSGKGHRGQSFILKADIPIGVGGLQFLTMSRYNFLTTAPANINLSWGDFGYGGKFTLALREADFDFGIFYQKDMPFRSFLSIKTTLWDIEFFNEYLLAVDVNNSSNVSGAFSFGFIKTFFDGKLDLNAELFYNGESGSYMYNPETELWTNTITPFVSGLNLSINLLYRPSWEMGNPRLFMRLLYAPMQQSAQLIPGILLTPWPNIEFYAAMPMALGSKEGYYYKNTGITDPDDPDKMILRPFSVVFMVTLNGSFRFAHNF